MCSKQSKEKHDEARQSEAKQSEAKQSEAQENAGDHGTQAPILVLYSTLSA